VYDLLKFKELMFDLERRSIDVGKHLTAVQTELWFVWRKSDDLYEARINTVLKDVDMNFRRMVFYLNQSARESLAHFTVVQHLFVAMLAFGIMDRLLGNEWSVTAMPWVKEQFWGALATESPHLWLLIGIVVWVGITYVETRSLRQTEVENTTGWATCKVILKQPINLDALDDFIGQRKVISERVVYSQGAAIVLCTWKEPARIMGDPWGGYKPEVMLEYDDDNGFVFNAFITYNTRMGKQKARDLRDILVDELVEANVIPPPEEDGEGGEAEGGGDEATEE